MQMTTMISSAQIHVGESPRPELTLVLNVNPAQKPALIPNIMLHLVHPVGCGTLRNILPHIRSFREFLSLRHPGNETLQMADDVLIDTIERSGIDLGKLELLIAQQLEDIQNFSGHFLTDACTSRWRLTYSNL